MLNVRLYQCILNFVCAMSFCVFDDGDEDEERGLFSYSLFIYLCYNFIYLFHLFLPNLSTTISFHFIFLILLRNMKIIFFFELCFYYIILVRLDQKKKIVSGKKRRIIINRNELNTHNWCLYNISLSFSAIVMISDDSRWFVMSLFQK